LFIEKATVASTKLMNDGIYLIKVFSPSIASVAKPGQFCNIKVSENTLPLLRRPFSICNVEGDHLFFLFDIHGEGTNILSKKNVGDTFEILGPLGKGFNYYGDYETAVILAGGMGAAPFPFLNNSLPKDKNILTFIGARSKKQVVTYGLKNFSIATDDGSEGYKGTVLGLFNEKIKKEQRNQIRIFACGPNAMLSAVQKYCIENEYDCQISIESAMACGFGICQGCPVVSAEDESYLLVCKDGPVFDARAIKL
jgi:dihydroorotate dehydrogenase electron transfer subunit